MKFNCKALRKEQTIKTMHPLDLKIPPPAIAIICGGFAWLLAHFTPGFDLDVPAKIPIVAVLVLVGLSLDLSGLLSFRKAKTTFNPLSPSRSKVIVQSGLYRFTRNPMYLGMVFELLGLCVFLANPLTVTSVAAFMAYITRFQIVPEERLLLAKFGAPYARYTRSVRRWV